MQIIEKLANGGVIEGIAGITGTEIDKLFSSGSGSARIERF